MKIELWLQPNGAGWLWI